MKLIVLGLVTIFIGAFIAFFYPVIKAEINLYFLNHNGLRFQVDAIQTEKRQLIPNDDQFGIVINKIAANGKVQEFDVVNNNLSLEYFLQRGLVHLSDSARPGSIGNVVIITQTSGGWYWYTRTNPEFYLIYKLMPGDVIEVFYKGERFDYIVTENSWVSEKRLENYTAASDQKILTILSGWPPGTMMFRLVVQAKMIEQ
ncbi:MAG: sortase [Microgenomates group bacterium]|jgi:hypothetical protein